MVLRQLCVSSPGNSAIKKWFSSQAIDPYPYEPVPPMSAADLDAARVDLAAVYRICARHGLSEGGTSVPSNRVHAST